MNEKHTHLDVARAAFAIVLSLPWVLVTEAVDTVRSRNARPALLP